MLIIRGLGFSVNSEGFGTISTIVTQALSHWVSKGCCPTWLPPSSRRPRFFPRINDLSSRIKSWRLWIIFRHFLVQFLDKILSGSKHKVSPDRIFEWIRNFLAPAHDWGRIYRVYRVYRVWWRLGLGVLKEDIGRFPTNSFRMTPRLDKMILRITINFW